MSDKPEVKVTLKDVLAEIDARIAHIEDATLDNRDVLIKLVKQSNQIVKFLHQLEIEVEETDFEDLSFPGTSPDIIDDKRLSQAKHIKELVEEFLEKRTDLKEFEEELKKVKSLLTPGQVGEA